MKNYVSPGDTIVVTTAAAHTSGDVVVTNEVVGIAMDDALIAVSAVLAIEGVYRLAKDNGTAINEGDLVDFDASVPEVTKAIVAAAGDVENFGIAMETVVLAGTFINVKLLPGAGTFN